MQAVAVPARIDADNAVKVLASLSAALADAGADPVQPLALDLAPLQHFDSSALSLLLQLARKRLPIGDNGKATRKESPPLFLLNPPVKLHELAQLYGVDAMLFGSQGGGTAGT